MSNVSASELTRQPVDDSSARIEIVDGSGATVVGPAGHFELGVTIV
jgi:hypothetical protein